MSCSPRRLRRDLRLRRCGGRATGIALTHSRGSSCALPHCEDAEPAASTCPGQQLFRWTIGQRSVVRFSSSNGDRLLTQISEESRARRLSSGVAAVWSKTDFSPNRLAASRARSQTLKNVRETEPIDAVTLLVVSVRVIFEYEMLASTSVWPDGHEKLPEPSGPTEILPLTRPFSG